MKVRANAMMVMMMMLPLLLLFWPTNSCFTRGYFHPATFLAESFPWQIHMAFGKIRLTFSANSIYLRAMSHFTKLKNGIYFKTAIFHNDFICLKNCNKFSTSKDTLTSNGLSTIFFFILHTNFHITA